MHPVFKILMAVGAAALTSLAQAQSALPVIPLTAGMYAIQAEVAASSDARERGLMFRK